MESKTDFNGQTIAFEYDANNRLTTKSYPDDTSVEFTYTPTGRRETVTDARGTTSYEYDARDRLLSRTDYDGTAESRTIGYTYDDAGNRTSVTVPSGTTGYTYDALNRMATVTDPDAGLTSHEYNEVGALVQTELPNGTVETREYDDLNRLLLLENTGPEGVISSYDYTLDAVGNRTRVVEDSGRTVDYTYDALYRLIGEDISDADSDNRTIDYSYDPVGNRLTRDDSAQSLTAYQYDDNDRLLLETLAGDETRYTYDDNGSTLSKTSPTDHVLYKWDLDNRLAAVDTDGDGTDNIEYQYNADGIRVASIANGEETRYFIDANRPYAQVLEEYTPGGIIKVSYVHGLDLISQNRPAETGKSFYHVDGLGSTRALTDSSGNVTDRYIYDAFGRTIGQVGSTGNVYLFAGEQRDLATGLDYLRARWMNPGSGRFYGVDPYGGNPENPVTLHRFLYAGLNPVSNVDPSGNFFGLIELMTAQAIMSNLYTANALRLQATFDRSMTTIGRILQPGAQMQAIGMTLLASGIPTGYTIYSKGRQLSATGFKDLSSNFAKSHIEFGITLVTLSARLADFKSQVLRNAIAIGGKVEEALDTIEDWAEIFEELKLLDTRKPSTAKILAAHQKAKEAISLINSIPATPAEITDRFLNWFFLQ